MTGDLETPRTPAVNDVIEALFSQLMSVMGMKHPNWVTRCLFPIFLAPTRRMSNLLVELDKNIPRNGWNPAVNQFLSHLISQIELYGEENIPTQGSLMVVCNHPAALDVVILTAAIKRNDLKIIASDIPIVQMLPHIADHTIPVPYNIPMRLHTVRSAIRHLHMDGSILIFPRGNVEPDPAVSPAAEKSLAGWSPSVELFLRQVPKTMTVVAIASGMLSAGWYRNPLVRIWKKYEQRQKVAEIFQIASQLLTGKTPAATPRVSFSSPLAITDLGGENAPGGALLTGLIAEARGLLTQPPHN